VEIEESDGEGEGEGPEVVELFQFGTSAELSQKAEAKASLAHTIHPYNQRKDLYKEQRTGKAARLASWRKMTQPGEFCWCW
jgi:hypothetical protein